MSLKQFYMSRLNEGLHTGDEEMIKYYEKLILELDRQEYVNKMKEMMRKTTK